MTLTYFGDVAHLTLGLCDALTFHDGIPSQTPPFAVAEWDGNPARLTVDIGARTVVTVAFREGIRRFRHHPGPR